MSDPRKIDGVALASGGLDSSTALAIAVSQGHHPLPLTFEYGQNHSIEIDSARAVAHALCLPEPLVLPLPFGAIGGSALLGDGEIPQEPATGATSREGIPATYVPARNLVFLSLAVAVAESRSVGDIWIGVNALDFSGYPDCRPEFLEAFSRAAEIGTREGSTSSEPFWRLKAPLVELTKAQIISRGSELGLDFSLTTSCYDPDSDRRACGRCDSCGLRRRGFEEAGVPDPTLYR